MQINVPLPNSDSILILYSFPSILVYIFFFSAVCFCFFSLCFLLGFVFGLQLCQLILHLGQQRLHTGRVNLRALLSLFLLLLGLGLGLGGCLLRLLGLRFRLDTVPISYRV